MDFMYKLISPDILVPIVAILMPIPLVAIALAFVRQAQERRHRMVEQFLEKGLPVPPELLGASRRGEAPLMRALTLVGAGAGICGFLYVLLGSHSGVWAAGLIPLAVGVAQLIALKFEPARPEPLSPRERG
jgi:hypothetical protein